MWSPHLLSRDHLLFPKILVKSIVRPTTQVSTRWQTFFQSSYLFILCLSVMLVRFWLEPASTENCHHLLPLVSQKTIQFSTFQSILDCLSAPPLTPPLAPCALGPIRMQHSLVSPYYGGYRFVCVIRCQPEGEDLERFSSCIQNHEANNYQ